MSYNPPFSIDAEILNLVAEVSELTAGLKWAQSQSPSLRLRRVNQVRTIQGSLAIEGNALSCEQVTAILEGKRVLAPLKEIQEVKNAIDVYESMSKWSCNNESDLLKAHKILMQGLIESYGKYRSKGVGVMGKEDIIHVAPPAEQVSPLIKSLFSWLKTSQDHPLIKASVFHYEFEFIHPFDDGNGRIGRLWQTLILNHWHDFFSLIPVESIIYDHQQEYYQALNHSTQLADCAPFIKFTLKIIKEAIQQFLEETGQVTYQVTGQVKKLLKLCKNDMSRKELMSKLKLKGRDNFNKLYLKPALLQGLIEMTTPDKPNSRSQKYRLTRLGRSFSDD
ncbi:Fic family protein [Lentisphaera marina]|uniref:Fic family protein n=1 Tax=Lentisphaera marina TaxID=1111041 RepID=UPI003B682D9C